MKKLNAALFFLGLGFLAYLVWRVGPRDLWQQISALGWGTIPIVLSEGVGNFAHTIGWRHCISKSQPRVPLLRLFRIAMAGFAINYVTPTASLGGEVSKASLLASVQNGPAAVSSVLLDKLTSATAHLFLALLGSFFLLWRVHLPPELWIAVAATTVLVAGGMGAFLVIQKRGKLGAMLRWLVDHRLGGRWLEQAERHVSEVDEALKQFHREQPRDFWLAFGWHVVGHATLIAQVWLFLVLLGQPAPVITVAGAGCLSLWFDFATFFVPLNLGTLEGSRILALKSVGSSVVFGMALGVAIRIAQLFWAVFGLINYGLLSRRASAASLPKPQSACTQG
jgi:glycosyltransferase 2 family protein